VDIFEEDSMSHTAFRRSLSILCLIAACTVASTGVERFEKTHDLAGELATGDSLRLENLLGSVTVEGGGPAGRVTLRALVVADGETPAEAQALAESVRINSGRSGSAVRVHVVYPVETHPTFRPPKSDDQGFFSKWWSKVFKKDPLIAKYGGKSVTLGPTKGATPLAVHVSVTVPHDVNVEVQQVMGTVHCLRLRGRLDVDATHGEVLIERIYGTVRARTDEGNLAIMTAKGETVDAEIRAGDLELIDVKADVVRIGTGEGAIAGEKLGAGALTIEALNGTVSLDELDATKFVVDTGSGDIDLGLRLQRAREGSIRSGSGDVTLRLGTFAPFDLLIASTSGEIKSKGLPVETVAGDGGQQRLKRGTGGARIEVTTGGGGVILREQ
jgi:hypothetical protein